MRGLRPFTPFIMTRVVRFLLALWFGCLAAVCLATILIGRWVAGGHRCGEGYNQ